MIDELRLHIGAHKTATTHLQDSLAAQSGRILEGGLVYLSRGFVRRSGLVQGIIENHRPAQSGGRGFRSLDDIIMLPEGHPRRIVISEEDILGMSIDLLDGIYPRAAGRLKPWAAVMGGARPRLFLSIRNYADILPSAYSQALRDGTLPHAMASYRTHWLGRKPSWISLIKTIQTAFEDAPLTVWSMDFYRHSAAAVRRAVTGLDLPGELETAPDGTRRLTASAVRRIEALGPSLSRHARMQALSEIVASETGSEPFDPLPPEEKAFHSERYARDLEAIKNMPLTFLG
jgi:hypothetical protein